MNTNLKLSPYFVDDSNTPGFDWNFYQDKVDEITESLLEVLMAPETTDFVAKLLERKGLSELQGQELARIIRDIIIGDLYLGNFIATIATKLQVDQTKAKDIANIIISELFGPVIDDIKQVQIQKFGSSSTNSINRQVVERGQSVQQAQDEQQHYPGEDLPETGGNIIDLRQK